MRFAIWSSRWQVQQQCMVLELNLYCAAEDEGAASTEADAGPAMDTTDEPAIEEQTTL